MDFRITSDSLSVQNRLDRARKATERPVRRPGRSPGSCEGGEDGMDFGSLGDGFHKDLVLSSTPSLGATFLGPGEDTKKK